MFQQVGYGTPYQVGIGFQVQQYGQGYGLSPLAELSGLTDRLMGAPVRPGGGSSPEFVALAAGVGGYLGAPGAGYSGVQAGAWAGSMGWGAQPANSWATSGAWGNQGSWAAAGAENQYGGSWAAAGARPGESWAATGTYWNDWSSGRDQWSGGWGGWNGGGCSQGNWFGGGNSWSPGGWGCAPEPCDWMSGWNGGWCHPAPTPPERPPHHGGGHHGHPHHGGGHHGHPHRPELPPTPPTPPTPPVPPTPPAPEPPAPEPPAPPTPPTPPAPPTPPNTDLPGVPPAARLPLVPHVDTDSGWSTASNILATRLVGSDANTAAIHQGGNNPWHDNDGKLQERSAVWAVMQLNDQVLYDTDRKVFVTKDGAGTTTDKFTLAQVLEVRNRSHAEERHVDTARWLQEQQGLDIPGLQGIAHWDDNRGGPMYNPNNLIRPGYFNWRPGVF